MAKFIKSLRVWRSPYSDFYKDEILKASRVYTQDYFHKVADAGFTAIWIRGILRDLVKQDVFPEWGTRSGTYQQRLQTMIRRADKAGIRVLLYIQAPRGLPENAAFWRRHPDVRGVTYHYRGDDTSVFCVSHPQVREYLFEGTRALSKSLPDLGGIITITMSEHMQHCYSHYGNPDVPELAIPLGQPTGCSRCDARPPYEVVLDILRSMQGGLQAAGNNAELVAWNWSWSFLGNAAQNRIIAGLPQGVKVMAGFERGDTKIILGKERPMDEYSLSFAGPSKRFVASCKTARRHGKNVMAKLQLGTTHELATVPNLPLIGSLYDKARAMRKMGVKDFMGCWNFGNMLSANTSAFNRFLTAKRLPPKAQALAAFARDYFPGCNAKKVAEAWRVFGRAMDSYPFSIPFLYWGPVNYAVAHPIEPGPLDPVPVGPSWMPAKRGDELKETFTNYFTLSEIIKGLGILTKTWWQGAEIFEGALADCKIPKAQEEINSVRMAGHCFQSGWNLYRAYRLRRSWNRSKFKALKSIMQNERDHLADAAAIAQSDKRMGFHSEPQLQMFTAASIRKKLKRLDTLLKQTGTTQ